MPDPVSWSMDGPAYLAALAFGYLLGSIPFGLIFTRMAGLGDIRDIGSGNIGATNVLRTGNKKLAGATFLADAFKGIVAVLVARNYGPDIMVIAAFGAFLGHLYPVWLKFKGGKGVSTFVGVSFALYLPLGFFVAIAWLATAFLTRISSASALTAAALAPVFSWYMGQFQLMELGIVLAVMIWWKHQDNVRRLLAGTEPKIGGKKDAPAGQA